MEFVATAFLLYGAYYLYADKKVATPRPEPVPLPRPVIATDPVKKIENLWNTTTEEDAYSDVNNVFNTDSLINDPTDLSDPTSTMADLRGEQFQKILPQFRNKTYGHVSLSDGHLFSRGYGGRDGPTGIRKGVIEQELQAPDVNRQTWGASSLGHVERNQLLSRAQVSSMQRPDVSVFGENHWSASGGELVERPNRFESQLDRKVIKQDLNSLKNESILLREMALPTKSNLMIHHPLSQPEQSQSRKRALGHVSYKGLPTATQVHIDARPLNVDPDVTTQMKGGRNSRTVALTRSVGSTMNKSMMDARKSFGGVLKPTQKEMGSINGRNGMRAIESSSRRTHGTGLRYTPKDELTNIETIGNPLFPQRNALQVIEGAERDPGLIPYRTAYSHKASATSRPMLADTGTTKDNVSHLYAMRKTDPNLNSGRSTRTQLTIDRATDPVNNKLFWNNPLNPLIH